MSYADKVRRASSPQEAVLFLAEGIDELLIRLESQEVTPDPWGDWSPASTLDALGLPTVSQALAIEDLEKQIAFATDGNDRRALEAQLRLLKDDGQAPPPAVPEGVRINVDGDLVGFPSPDGPRMDAREDFCSTYPMHTFLAQGNELTPDDFREAYALGGPMWLYLYDRDAIMAMPDDWRRAFIEDIHLDSPAQAQEVARDILKDTAPGELPTISED